jgi:hypothetical protein
MAGLPLSEIQIQTLAGDAPDVRALRMETWRRLGYAVDDIDFSTVVRRDLRVEVEAAQASARTVSEWDVKPCAFRGDLLRMEPCKACTSSGHTEVPVHACELWGECIPRAAKSKKGINLPQMSCGICGLATPPGKAVVTVPPPAPPPRPLLTVGCTVYNDWRAFWSTFQILRLQLMPEVASGEVELLVIDNNYEKGDKTDSGKIRNYCRSAGIRYETFMDVQGTAKPRSVFFERARGEWGLIYDPHVIVSPHAHYPTGGAPTQDVAGIRGFLQWLRDGGRERSVFVHGPMLHSGGWSPAATHMEPIWHRGEDGGQYGKWAVDWDFWNNPARRELPIAMHGLGLWACRTDLWCGFHSRHFGFGGIEGYIQEKMRRRGVPSICLKDLQWFHLFGRAPGQKFVYSGSGSQIHNYLWSWHELATQPGFEQDAGRYQISDVFDFFGGREACLKHTDVKTVVRELRL